MLTNKKTISFLVLFFSILTSMSAQEKRFNVALDLFGLLTMYHYFGDNSSPSLLTRVDSYKDGLNFNVGITGEYWLKNRLSVVGAISKRRYSESYNMNFGGNISGEPKQSNFDWYQDAFAISTAFRYYPVKSSKCQLGIELAHVFNFVYSAREKVVTSYIDLPDEVTDGKDYFGSLINSPNMQISVGTSFRYFPVPDYWIALNARYLLGYTSYWSSFLSSKLDCIDFGISLGRSF